MEDKRPAEDHRHRDFEPHERATLRDIMESILRGRWLRGLFMRIVGYVTAVILLIALLRDEVAAWASWFFGRAP